MAGIAVEGLSPLATAPGPQRFGPAWEAFWRGVRGRLGLPPPSREDEEDELEAAAERWEEQGRRAREEEEMELEGEEEAEAVWEGLEY